MIPSAHEAEKLSAVSGKPGISAVVVCFNEEENIGLCLESLKWCDEIIVVDSFSSDKTVEICRRYTKDVIQRPWKGYKDQMSFAVTLARREWVLLLDADERVSKELRSGIEETLGRVENRVAGFSMPRLVYYFGRWWWRGGWYPDFKTRLFRPELARCAGLDPHPRILVRGAVRRLKSPLNHFSYRDIADHIDRLNRFTTISSRQLRQHGKRSNWLHSLFRPAARFFRFYVWKRGFLEGFPGFFVAVTAAYYVFLKYAKLRELELEDQKVAANSIVTSQNAK